MPTAGRATGAILFALLGLAVVRLIGPGLPGGLPAGPAQLAAAGFGALWGWRVAGRAGGGRGAAAARGLGAAVLTAFWTLALGAVWQMLRRSLRLRYDDPAEALADAATLLVEYGRAVLHPPALGLLLLGGAAAGIAAAWVGRRLP